jgi:GDP-mannose 6-dehydrogenase
LRVSVFGLGYVGAVSSGCLSRDGHVVLGVDINPDKVRLINEGQSPVVEPGLQDLIAAAVRNGRLRATPDAVEAVRETDLSIVAVGTPGRLDGSLDLLAIERVTDQIGAALREKAGTHCIVVRSTVLPGTVRNVVVPRLARGSCKQPGRDFHVLSNPEFLREGTAIEDYDNPPFTLVGCDDRRVGELAAALYARTSALVLYETVENAEMVKYVCNAWHALKVTFANEVGMLSQALGIDSHEVMSLVCKDTKLSISPAYLRPGFAFGGSCLPKDLNALRAAARQCDLLTPLLDAIVDSNEKQVERAVAKVLALGKRPVSILGLSFKAGTDDLRQSPLVSIARGLLGKTPSLRLYDRNVLLARLLGANLQYIEKEIPEISSLLVSELEAAVAHAEVLVIGNDSPEFRSELPRLLRPGQAVFDLVHIPELARIADIGYEGIAW